MASGASVAPVVTGTEVAVVSSAFFFFLTTIMGAWAGKCSMVAGEMEHTWAEGFAACIGAATQQQQAVLNASDALGAETPGGIHEYPGELSRPLQKASEAIASCLSKPETYVAVCVNDGNADGMSFGGTTDPCAVGCVYSIGQINQVGRPVN